MRVLIATAVAIVLASPQATPGQPPSVSVALDHVAIYVSDVDRSAAFYQRLFGLKPVPAAVPLARWLVMANGVMLHIIPGRTTPLAHTRWDHIAVACADMTQMLALLDRQGVAWTSMDGKHSPQVRGDGVRQIFVQDPDGYWIEINDALQHPPAR